MLGKTKRNEEVHIALQAIGNHCRNGELLLFRTTELMFEDWHGFQSIGNNLTNYYAFNNCKVEDIKSPIERSFFYPILIGNSNGNQLQLFIENLLKMNFSQLMDMLKKISIHHYNVFEYNTIIEKSLNWFKKLCNRINKNKYRDAFHFWSAEHNKIDFFLSEDKKFRNELSMSLKYGKMHSCCTAIGVIDLVSQLQIKTDSIVLPESGAYYTLGESKIDYPWK